MQAKIRESKAEFDTKKFFASIKYLLTDKGFVIHMVAYGINIAVFSAVGTLLTQFILHFFEVSVVAYLIHTNTYIYISYSPDLVPCILFPFWYHNNIYESVSKTGQNSGIGILHLLAITFKKIIKNLITH